MLPGLRILFAITLLSVSIVIFGLGAAAFLRSAHEDVASAPWRPIETPVTARVDLAPTTLSMLRVEPEATIAVLTERADAAAAAVTPPAEVKTETPSPSPQVVAPEPPRTEPAPTPTAAKPAEAPAVAQVDPAPAAPITIAAVEPTREQKLPPAEAKGAEANLAETSAPATKTSEAKASETKASEAKVSDAKTSEAKTPETALEPTAAAAVDAQPAQTPTVVAALSSDRPEQPPAKSIIDPASAPMESLDVPLSAAATAETKAGADTLKADDKAIPPAAKVAALGDAATAETPPLPSKDVRIPNPRVDPAVLEAKRKQQQIAVQLRIRARAAARARRVAAARRAAAQARAAAAATTNPFGTPANTTTNNVRAN